MNTEIEKKIQISKPGEARRCLEAFASFKGKEVKSDIYFTAGNVKKYNAARHPVFRLRDNGGRLTLNFKEKVIVAGAEVNREHEIEVGDRRGILKFAEFMGFRILVRKKKTSFVYRYGGYTIELNRLSRLGWFVEIECLKKKSAGKADYNKHIKEIDSIFRKLNLDPAKAEPRLYIEMLLSKPPGRAGWPSGN